MNAAATPSPGSQSAGRPRVPPRRYHTFISFAGRGSVSRLRVMESHRRNADLSQPDLETLRRQLDILRQMANARMPGMANHRDAYILTRMGQIQARIAQMRGFAAAQEQGLDGLATRTEFNLQSFGVPTPLAPAARPQPTPEETPTEVAEIGPNLEEVLACPVCFEICKPPIFQCVSGHHICHDCKPKVQRVCPVCRQMVPPDLRNRGLETLYNSTKFTCVNKEEGCTENIRGDKFQDHVKHCGFKPFLCSYSSEKRTCTALQKSLRTTVQHFSEDHGIMTKTAGHYSIHNVRILPGTMLPLTCWEFDGQTFLEMFLVTFDGKVLINVMLLGDKTDAPKYEADIQLIRQGIDCSPNIRKVFLPIQPRSLRESSMEQLQNGDCSFSFTLDFFKENVARFDHPSQTYSWISRMDFKLKSTPDFMQT